MKTIMKPALFKALIYISCLTLVSCNSRATQTKISVLYDISDPLLRKPTLNDILTLTRLDNDIWQGITIRIETISNIFISDQWEIILPEENHLLVSEKYRLQTIARFKNEIIKRFQYLDSLSNHKSLDHSVIFEKIAKVANRMSFFKEQYNYILVFSNLMENSNVNFYNSQTFKVLKNKPNIIKQKLTEEIRLEDLSGFKIYLLYKANSYEESCKYRITSNFFGSIFSSKSAIVQLELPVK